jgi:hypothetical protein
MNFKYIAEVSGFPINEIIPHYIARLHCNDERIMNSLTKTIKNDIVHYEQIKMSYKKTTAMIICLIHNMQTQKTYIIFDICLIDTNFNVGNVEEIQIRADTEFALYLDILKELSGENGTFRIFRYNGTSLFFDRDNCADKVSTILFEVESTRILNFEAVHQTYSTHLVIPELLIKTECNEIDETDLKKN